MPSSYLKDLETAEGDLHLDSDLATLAAADLKKIGALITAPKREGEVYFDTLRAAESLLPHVPDTLLGTLISRLDLFSVAFMRSLSDVQLRTAYAWSVETHRAFRTGKKYQNDHTHSLTFEMLRRGLFASADLEERAALLAIGGVQQEWSNFIQIWSFREGGAITYAEHVQGLHDATAALVALGAPMRDWFRSLRPVMQPDHVGNYDAMFLIGATFEPSDADYYGGLFAKLNLKYFANNTPTFVAEALVGRADGEAVITAIKAKTKGKRVRDLLDTAIGQWTTMRALLKPTNGSAPAVALDWGRTNTEQGLVVVRAAKDPIAVLEHGASSEDPVALLNVWMAIGKLARDIYDKSTKPRIDVPLALVTQLIGRIAARYIDGVPDLKALGLRIGGYPQAKQEFTVAFDTLRAIRPEDDEALKAALRETFDATPNKRFKSWVEKDLTQWHPELAESLSDRFARIVGEAANDKVKQVSRTVVFKAGSEKDDGLTPPKPTEINRLFGVPIGVAAAQWPLFGKRKMEHVITLETKLLPAASRRALAKDCVAIAVFVSSLREHEAFEPGTPHAAVVQLTATQVGERTPPGADAIGLVASTVSVPEKVFLGGKKTGSIAELRRLFDRDDFLQLDRTSPQWLQSPQPAKGFLFELDHVFASRLNMGDGGRFYVFAETAFVQST